MKPSYMFPSDHYEYVCNGKTWTLWDDQETIVEHKQYYCVVCTECCNVPVLHLLKRTKGNQNEENASS